MQITYRLYSLGTTFETFLYARETSNSYNNLELFSSAIILISHFSHLVYKSMQKRDLFGSLQWVIFCAFPCNTSYQF